MTQFAFFQGRLVPIEQAKISVMTHAFNYGTAVFAGIRAYWNEDEEQLFIFRAHDHYERLIQSASLLRIQVPHTPADLTRITQELLRAEGYRQNVYIRPLAYKSYEGIGVRLHDITDEVTIWSQPIGKYIENDEGTHACFSAWRRVDDNAIPARGKISGAYANSALMKSDAMLAGYDEALVLNEDGHLSEATAANVFIIRKGVAITPPVYANVLEGITVRTLKHLFREELGIEVVERNIDRTEVYLADEIFLCGTGVQFAAITRVEHRQIGDGKLGPISRRIRDLQADVLHGRLPKYRDWLTPVYTDEPVAVK